MPSKPDGPAEITDAPSDARVDALADAPIDAIVCGDLAFEDNGTIQTAFDSGVAATQSSRAFPGLVICPTNTDKDHFAVTLSANQNLEVLVDFTSTVPVLQASILNSGGIAIANATSVTSQQLRASSTNLPTGQYYVRVQAASGSGVAPTNAYQLTINVTGP